METPQEYDVYISYSWAKNKDKVHSMVERLKTEFRVWFDIETLPDGCNIMAECFNGLNNSKVFICCVTDVYAQSKICMRELALADSLGKPIIFVMFEDVKGLSYAEILQKIGPPSFLMAGKVPHNYDQVDNIVREIKRTLRR